MMNFKLLYLVLFFALLQGCAGSQTMHQDRPIDTYKGTDEQLVYRDLGKEYMPLPDRQQLDEQHRLNSAGAAMPGEHKSLLSGEELAAVAKKRVYLFRKGENLKESIRRWVGQSGYEGLIWNVENGNGDEITIPIVANANFGSDFREALSHVKTAYATAKGNPLYFDITIKESNKIVVVELLHFGS